MSTATNLMSEFTPAQATKLASTFGKAPIATYATGTAYTLTATSAAVDFGTLDPVVVITSPGTYEISGSGTVGYVGATFAANRVITIKARRTNNTAGDLTEAVVALTTGIVTTVTETAFTWALPVTYYTTTRSNDSITLFADVAVLPTAGTVTVASASIQARKLY